MLLVKHFDDHVFKIPSQFILWELPLIRRLGGNLSSLNSAVEFVQLKKNVSKGLTFSNAT